MGGQWPLTCLPSSLQIRWEKNITLGEPPGFLHSWWWCVQGLAWAGHGGGSVGACGETIVPPAAHSVFWDLYCAAPDRREACEHSSEAKAFQDYVSPRQGQALPGRGGRWGGGPAWPWLGLGGLGTGALCPPLGPGSLTGWGRLIPLHHTPHTLLQRWPQPLLLPYT